MVVEDMEASTPADESCSAQRQQARRVAAVDDGDASDAAIEALVGSGAASAGMVAKLAACRGALDRGVAEVAIVEGRDPAGLLALHGTRLVSGE